MSLDFINSLNTLIANISGTVDVNKVYLFTPIVTLSYQKRVRAILKQITGCRWRPL